MTKASNKGVPVLPPSSPRPPLAPPIPHPHPCPRLVFASPGSEGGHGEERSGGRVRRGSPEIARGRPHAVFQVKCAAAAVSNCYRDSVAVARSRTFVSVVKLCPEWLKATVGLPGISGLERGPKFFSVLRKIRSSRSLVLNNIIVVYLW